MFDKRTLITVAVTIAVIAIITRVPAARAAVFAI
jgi:hypothetical protein